MIAQIVLENVWAWGIGLPLVLGVLALFVRTNRRQGHGWWRIAALAGARCLALLILLLLASRPVRFIPETEIPARDRVALLVDRSKSMSLEGGNENRCRQAVGFLRTELLPALSTAGLRVDAMLFAEDARGAGGSEIANAVPDGKQTNLARAITQAVTQDREPPLAVVALTDGIATVATDNARGATALVENRVPFVGIGFGEEIGTRTLTLDHMSAPPVASPRQEFSISARLRITGTIETAPFGLTLFRDGQFVQQKTVSPGSGARVWQESFQVTQAEEGFYSYTVQLLPPPDRSVHCPNTEATAAVRILDEKEMRILFVQGGLTWDYKFIRLAVSADPSIQISSLSRAASGSQFMQSDGNDTSLGGGFPSTIQQLASYRVIVLSNLRVGDLTTDQQDLLAEFCSDLGGGLLMIGGATTFDASWQGSRLEQLLAVKFSASSRKPSDGRPFRLRVTREAFSQPVFQISESADHRSAWNRLPTFSDYAPVDAVKPGTQIWAVADVSGGLASKPVLIASQRYGAGLTAVICMQNLWRWRLAKESNPQHFDRFWQQLLRYLGEGSRDDVVLRLPDQRLEPRENIRVFVERRPDPRLGNVREQYRLRVTDAEMQTVADQGVALAFGQSTELTFSVPKAGLYRVTVLDRQAAVAAYRSLDIRNVDNELLYTARNMENLRQWANLSGGIAIRFEDYESADQLLDEIKAIAEQPIGKRPMRRPLGINGWILGMLLGCLCIEWVSRKRWGLV